MQKIFFWLLEIGGMSMDPRPFQHSCISLQLMPQSILFSVSPLLDIRFIRRFDIQRFIQTLFS